MATTKDVPNLQSQSLIHQVSDSDWNNFYCFKLSVSVSIPYSSGLRFRSGQKWNRRRLKKSLNPLFIRSQIQTGFELAKEYPEIASQSLIHQVSDSDNYKVRGQSQKRQVSIPYSSGLRFRFNLGEAQNAFNTVSIPYSSGLRFR